MSTPISPPSEAIRLEFESAGRLLTPEEFDAVADYDELYRYELIHGVLVVTPIPSEGQSDPNDELGLMLRLYGLQHPQGGALDKTMPERYIRTQESRRLADRVVWTGLGRVPDPRADVPTIAIEFVSGRRNWHRDYVEKRLEYALAGVLEYWVIDRFQRTMTVYCNVPGQSREVVLQSNEIYTTPLLPGFELSLARLFALADDWK